MRRFALLLVLLAAAPAQAAVLELHIGARFGGSTGSGIGGAQKDADFFAGAKGGTFGGVIGVEVLYIDFFIEHDQLTDGSGIVGTWTEVGVGPHFAFPLSGESKGQTYIDLGFHAGFGVGTGQQIDPPLDNAQVSDKGLMLGARAGIEFRPSRIFGVGISLPVEVGYMFKNHVPANDISNHYQTFHAMLLGTLTFHIGL